MMPAFSSVLMRTRKMLVASFMSSRRAGGDLLELGDHPHRIEPELGVEVLLLSRSDQVEQQGLEAVGGPVLDDHVLFGGQLRDGAVGPDLPELVVEGLVG